MILYSCYEPNLLSSSYILSFCVKVHVTFKPININVLCNKHVYGNIITFFFHLLVGFRNTSSVTVTFATVPTDVSCTTTKPCHYLGDGLMVPPETMTITPVATTAITTATTEAITMTILATLLLTILKIGERKQDKLSMNTMGLIPVMSRSVYRGNLLPMLGVIHLQIELKDLVLRSNTRRTDNIIIKADHGVDNTILDLTRQFIIL